MTTLLVPYASQILGQPGVAFGAAQAGNTLAAVAAAVPPASTGSYYVYAVLEPTGNNSRVFNSSHSNYVLPVITYFAQVTDPQGVADGPWILELQASVPPLQTTPTGSVNPDANSPMNFLLDQYSVLIVASGSVTAGDPTT
jgi:hypothetical protein